MSKEKLNPIFVKGMLYKYQKQIDIDMFCEKFTAHIIENPLIESHLKLVPKCFEKVLFSAPGVRASFSIVLHRLITEKYGLILLDFSAKAIIDEMKLCYEIICINYKKKMVQAIRLGVKDKVPLDQDAIRLKLLNDYKTEFDK